MNSQKRTGLFLVFVLSVSLISVSVTAFFMAGLYNRMQFRLLNNICESIIRELPEAEKTIPSVLKKIKNGQAADTRGTILTDYGYRQSDFAGYTRNYGLLSAAGGFLLGGILFLSAFWYRHKTEMLRIKALTDYLASRHNLIDIPDTKTAIQDNLFYRHVYYVLTIPKNFTQSCKSKTASLTVTKVPGSTSGYYVDSQVNAWVQEMHMLLASGYSAEDATVMLKEAMTEESHVTMLDQNGYGGNIPMHAYMYQYMPYIILSILCYVIITIMMSFNNPEVRSRILCTSISSRKYNLQLALGCTVIGLAVWFLCTLLPIILYGKTFLADTNLTYYLTNSFMMSLSALSLAFFVSTFTDKEQLISAVVNVVSLGMSFLCGVFVSMDILGKSVQKIAQFLPVYWYEVANNLLKSHNTFSGTQIHTLYTCYGIQLLFALAFLSLALIAGRMRRQTA